MNDTYGNVTYLGRGEHETYIDRNQSGKIGIYTTTPEKMFHYYVIPQSTGNRTDVRWAKLANTSGEGLFVESNRAFQFSIIPFSDVLLEKARHINDSASGCRTGRRGNGYLWSRSITAILGSIKETEF